MRTRSTLGRAGWSAPAPARRARLEMQLREDEKREVRTLARIIGLEKVASMI